MLQLLAQGMRFGIIGVLATAVHILVFIGCIETLDMRPLLANFPAFMLAFSVSFAGHFSWTFQMQQRGLQDRWLAALLKFTVVALFGLALNLLVVYLVVDQFGHPYTYAVVLMATAVPATLFLLQKFWAFT